jgi:hypothetical protein
LNQWKEREEKEPTHMFCFFSSRRIKPIFCIEITL